ncbi:MAG: polysaccharide deacetylase family protein, partial [Armatimonadia bacterium]|nr:polysaccharide deacetylase family protein [Armatimonadia bacterium]
MSGRSSQSTPKPRRLIRLIPALLLVILSVPAHARIEWPWSRASEAGSPASTPPVARQRLIETAELFPTWADWPGHGRMIVPGVYNTRRLMVDADTREPVAIDLALAEPRIVHSYAGGDDVKQMALTFDDGPSGTYTPQLLDIFARHNARCTFFTLGGLIGRHKQILKRAEDEGHEIAIHSWAHPSYTGLSNASIQADIARCRRTLDGV